MADDVTLKVLLMGEDKTASKAIQGVGESAEETGRKTSRAGAVMKGALSAEVVTRLADAVVDFGKESVEAYRDAAASQRQLDDAYKRFPALADVSIDRLRKQAAAIEAKTGADADDIASGQAVLARYKMTGKQLQEMTPLLVDYAKRTGKEIPAAAGVLGKGIMGSSRAMKELGIKFKDTGDPAKNLELIMDGLRDKVGGFAESEASTLDGKLGILQTRFGNVQEEIGEKLLPMLIQGAEWLGKLVDWVGQNTATLGPLATGLGIAAAAFMALNLVMAANPIGLIVIAIGALVGGLIWAYQNVSWFRDGVDAAFQAIGAVGRWLWNNALAPALRGIVQGFAWVIDGIGNMLIALGSVPGFEWARQAGHDLKGLAVDARAAATGIKDIPDPDVQTQDSLKQIDTLNTKIQGIKGKIVEAKAKGDDKEVDRLQGKLKALRDKKLKVEANVKKTGVTTIKPVDTGHGIKISAYAKGGRPTVGELAYFHADELWVPDTAGTVLTRSQSRNVLNSLTGPAPLTATTVVQQVKTEKTPARPIDYEAMAAALADVLSARGLSWLLVADRVSGIKALAEEMA
jgi:hypothetical protein